MLVGGGGGCETLGGAEQGVLQCELQGEAVFVKYAAYLALEGRTPQLAHHIQGFAGGGPGVAARGRASLGYNGVTEKGLPGRRHLFRAHQLRPPHVRAPPPEVAQPPPLSDGASLPCPPSPHP